MLFSPPTPSRRLGGTVWLTSRLLGHGPHRIYVKRFQNPFHSESDQDCKKRRLQSAPSPPSLPPFESKSACRHSVQRQGAKLPSQFWFPALGLIHPKYEICCLTQVSLLLITLLETRPPSNTPLTSLRFPRPKTAELHAQSKTVSWWAANRAQLSSHFTLLTPALSQLCGTPSVQLSWEAREEELKDPAFSAKWQASLRKLRASGLAS